MLDTHSTTIADIASDLDAALPAWLNAALKDVPPAAQSQAAPAPSSPSIAELIAQLTPPQQHGDHLAIALLNNQSRRIANLEERISREERTHMRYLLEDDMRHEQDVAEAIGMVALAYRSE